MSSLPLQFLAENIGKIIRDNGADQAFVLIQQSGQFGAHLEGDPELVAHAIGAMLARAFHGAQLERCVSRFLVAAHGTGESGTIAISGGEFSKSRVN